MTATKSPEKWIQLDEAADKTDGRITVGNLGLPTMITYDQLQINARAVERAVIGWGGAEQFVIGSYVGDKDATDVAVGSDGNGNAYAMGLGKIVRAQSAKSKSDANQELNATHKRNGVITVDVNSAALNDRLSPVDQINVAVRARQLDKAITTGARQGVWQHSTSSVLLDRWQFHDYLISIPAMIPDAALGGILPLTVLLDATQTKGALTGTVLFGMMFVNVLNTGTDAIARGDYNFRDAINDPFFTSMRPTRALAATAILLTNTLIRPTPQTEQTYK